MKRPEVEIEGGIRVGSNTRGPEDPIQTFTLPILVHEVESSINCGFRAQWGEVDVNGDRLEICSGAGFGSAWATISFRGKNYAIGAHEMVAAFLEAIGVEGEVKS